jgi:hypothetical protein
MKSSQFKIWLKLSGYSLAALLVMKGISYASLEEQVSKVNDLMLGHIATAVVGGGMALGGGYSIFSGNIMKGLGQLGVGALIGIGVALTKNQSIFSLLQ